MSEKILYALSALFQIIQNFGKQKAIDKVQSIAIIKLDEIGDFVYALHIFDSFRIRFPKAKITLVIKSFNKIFVENSEVDVVHQVSDLKKPVDLIIDLRGNLDSLLFAIKTNPKRYYGRGIVRIKNKFLGGQEHEVLTNWLIVKKLFSNVEMPHPRIITDSNNRNMVNSFLKNIQVVENGFVVIHPGARDESRRWAKERYAELTERLFETFKLSVIFVGSTSEKSLVDSIIQLSKVPCFSFVSANHSLLDFAHLSSLAKLFIGNESGPLHVASTMGVRNIGLFGPGVKDVFYPLGVHSHVIHYFGDTDEEKLKSMTKIEVAEVVEKINKMFSK